MLLGKLNMNNRIGKRQLGLPSNSITNQKASLMICEGRDFFPESWRTNALLEVDILCLRILVRNLVAESLSARRIPKCHLDCYV